MLLLVKTESGSEYEFDNRNLTYRRVNEKGLLGVPGATHLLGRLRFAVDPRAGQRMFINTVNEGELWTTPVTSIEVR